MLSKSKRLFAVGKLNLTVLYAVPYHTVQFYNCNYPVPYCILERTGTDGISLDKTINYCFMVNFRHTYFWLLESRNIYRYRVHIQRGTRTFSISSLVMVSVSPSL